MVLTTRHKHCSVHLALFFCYRVESNVSAYLVILLGRGASCPIVDIIFIVVNNITILFGEPTNPYLVMWYTKQILVVDLF